MLNEIQGLPAHPLIVHLPIVFGPILGLLTLAMLVPRWRPMLVKPVAAFAVVFAFSCFLATESGEQFAETLQVGSAIHEHQEAAETLRNLAFLLAIVLVAYAVLYTRLTPPIQLAGVIFIALLGVGVIAFTIKTGHLGAEQVWKTEWDALTKAQQR